MLVSHGPQRRGGQHDRGTLLGQPAFAFSGATDFLGEIPIMLLAVALYRNRSMVSPTEDAAEN